MSVRNRISLAAAVALAITGTASAQLTTTTVARTGIVGAVGPNLGAGVTYSTLSSLNFSFWLDGLGNMGLEGFITPAAADADSGLWVAPIGSHTRRVAEGGAAPSIANAAFSSFDFPTSRGNYMAFRSDLVGAGVTVNDDRTLYGGSLTSQKLLAREGSLAPTFAAGSNINIGALGTSPAVNASGTVLWQSTLVGAGVLAGTANAVYVTDVSGANPVHTLVARAGSAVPAIPGATWSTTPQDLRIAANGQIAFQSGVVLSGSGSRVIFVGTPNNLQVVSRNGTQVPDAPAGVLFADTSTVNNLAINNNGKVAFFHLLSGTGVVESNSRAIFAGTPGALKMIQRQGNIAVYGASTTYTSAATPTINSNGDVAFVASLSDGPATLDKAIFRTTNNTAGPTEIVVRTGDAVPGLAGITFSDVVVNGFNSQNVIAYQATLTGTGVDASNNVALFLWTPTSGSVLVARRGTLYNLGGGEFKTINTVGSLSGSNVGGGLQVALDDQGRFMYRALFTDATEAVFTATLPLALPAGGAQWNNPNGGAYATAGNWSGGVPNAVGATANFLTVGATSAVNVASNTTLGTLNFNHTASYALNGAGTLTLNAAGNALVNVQSGTHTVANPVSLATATTFNIVTGSGAVSLSNFASNGHAITKNGYGIASVSRILNSALTLNAGVMSLLDSGGAPRGNVWGSNTSGGNGSTPGTGSTTVLSSLTIAGSTDAWNAALDIRNNDVVIRNAHASIEQIKNQIANAFNNGAWNAGGILSSRAAEDGLGIGYATNADFAYATFSGVAVTTNDVLIKYTWVGDADLNGVVNGDDYLLWLQTFNSSGVGIGWAQGDFDYNAIVNGDDYLLWLQNFGNGVGDPLAAVPEPTTLGLTTLAAAALLVRRRRAAR